MTDTRKRSAGRSGPRTIPAISATDAAKTFGRLVDRVREEHAVYTIERGGTPVARIGPVPTASCTVADFVALFRTRERVDEGYLREVEAGMKRWNKPSVPRSRWTS